MRRTIAALLASAGIVAMPISSAHASACAGADRMPRQLSPAAARGAVLCLINAQRLTHGLPALRLDAKLTRAAQAHSADMAAHRYFGHDSRDGHSFFTRIARTGWTRHRSAWTVGENLAWGAGAAATPAAIVAAWMQSPPHRRNILRARFRAVGIGIADRAPNGRGGGTYSTDFGS